MSLLRAALLKTPLVLALVLACSGLAPLSTQWASSAEGYTDCCPDEGRSSEGDEGEAPCSPLCSDCSCSLGSRYVPRVPVLAAVAEPAASARLEPTRVAEPHGAPMAAFVDELLRPPRA